PQADRILYSENRAKGPVKRLDIDATLMDGSPVTASIAGEQTILRGQTRSLKIVEDTPKQRAENIRVQPLLLAAPSFWGEIDYTNPAPRPDAGVDNEPPLYPAVAAERGA